MQRWHALSLQPDTAQCRHDTSSLSTLRATSSGAMGGSHVVMTAMRHCFGSRPPSSFFQSVGVSVSWAAEASSTRANMRISRWLHGMCGGPLTPPPPSFKTLSTSVCTKRWAWRSEAL